MLDPDAYRLDKAGVAVPLEPKAFDLLTLMVQRPGHLFSKQEIFDAVWPDTAVTDHALTRVIAQLRRALGDEAREATYIETVPTRGYRWIRPVEQIHAGGRVSRLLVGDAGGTQSQRGRPARRLRITSRIAGGCPERWRSSALPRLWSRYFCGLSAAH